VRREGVFVLRYRMFDLFSAAGGERASTLAELYGGPFKVYSTRDFPGLEPSTDLTKVLLFLSNFYDIHVTTFSRFCLNTVYVSLSEMLNASQRSEAGAMKVHS